MFTFVLIFLKRQLYLFHSFYFCTEFENKRNFEEDSLAVASRRVRRKNLVIKEQTASVLLITAFVEDNKTSIKGCDKQDSRTTKDIE